MTGQGNQKAGMHWEKKKMQNLYPPQYKIPLGSLLCWSITEPPPGGGGEGWLVAQWIAGQNPTLKILTPAPHRWPGFGSHGNRIRREQKIKNCDHFGACLHLLSFGINKKNIQDAFLSKFVTSSLSNSKPWTFFVFSFLSKRTPPLSRPKESNCTNHRWLIIWWITNKNGQLLVN